MVRSLGVEIVSSGDLIQLFEATWDDDQWRMHLAAESAHASAYDLAWALIADRVRHGGTIRETEVQAAIMDHFHRHGLTTYSPPIVRCRPAQRRPALRAGPGQDGDRPGRFRADRPLGQARQAPGGLQRPDPRRLRRRDRPRTYEDIFADRGPGPRRGDRLRPRRLCRRRAAAGLGSRSTPAAR